MAHEETISLIDQRVDLLRTELRQDAATLDEEQKKGIWRRIEALEKTKMTLVMRNADEKGG